MFSAFKIAASTAIFSFSSLFVFDAIAKPQNARSRIYNEFHTDLFAKEPPLRSECPSWKDVVKGDTFDNEAFSALSKNGRPCFVNRGKYAYDIADFSGNTSFGRNFAVYRTNKTNHYEIDFAVRFYVGGLIVNQTQDFKTFKERISSCIKNNPIKLTDGERFLKINLPIILKIKDKNKFDKARNSDYKYTDIEKGLFGINLHKKRKRNNIANYSIDIKCHTIIHELLHIPGLHDLYNSKNKITSKLRTYEAIIPLVSKNKISDFKEEKCKYKLKKECRDILTAFGLIKEEKRPLFDCRNPKDYNTTGDNAKNPNIMDNQKFFDRKLGISFNICKTNKSTKIKNKNQRHCDKGDKVILSSVVSSEKKLKNVHRYANNTLKFKDSEYYISYFDRRNSKSFPPSLTREQFSFILHTNNLDHPEVREFARIAKNTYRSKYEKGVFGGCRR